MPKINTPGSDSPLPTHAQDFRLASQMCEITQEREGLTMRHRLRNAEVTSSSLVPSTNKNHTIGPRAPVVAPSVIASSRHLSLGVTPALLPPLLALVVILLATPLAAQDLVPLAAPSQSYVYFDGAFSGDRPYTNGPVTLMGWAVGCGVAVTDIELVVDGQLVPNLDHVTFTFLFRRHDVRNFFASVAPWCKGVALYNGILIGFNPWTFPGSHTLQLFIRDSLGRESYSNAKAYVFRD